ncbi:LysR family transcriptional regulator [Roseibium sediminicola]|uniref:LysR family transcriptional regulator n=1 Tax=Roseibium sediminicola TaxID=2933272 RepID=A0ABT0GYU5_9HYPH|nr:LysR family transcriptional regulator [Roseibium sp. CAU 1639]MCK7614598.1 LysR family transcriptional regulator [Roseibium sp. CAU 1639]
MNASPSPYQVKAFTFAAREGSISAAAQALGVTQSSVTQHIAKLEAHMGTRLFIRRRTGLELTRAGKELFSVSDRLATMEQLVHEKVSDYSALTDGHIRLIANAPRPAMPIIAEYGRRYPKVQIDFTLYNWTTAMSLLAERQADIAIVTDPQKSPSLFTHELRRSAYKAHLLKSHPLARRTRISLADLQSETLVLPEDGSLTQKVVRTKFREFNQDLPRILRTTTFPMVKEAILHNLGIGLLLENSLFPSDRLAAVPVIEMPETYRDCIAIPADKRELRLIRSFLDVAVEVRAGGGF